MDLTIQQGADYAVAWPITNPDDTPTDLTGWTVRSHVRARHTSDAILHEWSTEKGNASTTDGHVTLAVPAAVSSAWDWPSTTGVYDVELTSPEGKVYRVDEGRVSYSREVTR